MKPIYICLSCEHGYAELPLKYKKLFEPYADLFSTHRAIDFGSLHIAQNLSKSLNLDLFLAQATRLLIDCNRSLGHRQSFSEITAALSVEEQYEIVKNYYLPFRQALETRIQEKIQQGHQVWHFSIHSFTPQWDGHLRNTEIGLLYDSRRRSEMHLANRLKNQINSINSRYKVRKNYPYAGKTDGFTSSLRKKYTEIDYLGLELESNQRLVFEKDDLNALTAVWCQAMQGLIKEIPT